MNILNCGLLVMCTVRRFLRFNQLRSLAAIFYPCEYAAVACVKYPCSRLHVMFKLI